MASQLMKFDSVKSQQLHKILSSNEIENLHEIFCNAPNQKCDPIELRKILDQQFGIYYSDAEYENLFLKLNTNRDNQCDWDEFVSLMILGFQEDDPYNQKETLNMPVTGTPLVRKSMHHHSIVRITFCPTVLPDRSVDYTKGSFITTAKDGSVNFWSMDFDLQKSGTSKSSTLKVAKTWILDSCFLVDVRIFCTSSIERDLRFYDTTANNFILKIQITRFPSAINTITYYFPSTSDDCRLFLGDYKGNVRVLTFNPIGRGPFQSNTGFTVKVLTYNDLVMGTFSGLGVQEFLGLHVEMVRQIEFIPSMNAFISCGECPKTANIKTVATGLAIVGMGVQKFQTQFKVPDGVSCFSYDLKSNQLATGGPDWILRLWNPIMPQKANAILTGHNAGISFLLLQDNGEKLYSFDKTRVLNIWDTREQNLLQTYIHFAQIFPDRGPLVAVYSDISRDLTICGMKIATVKCCPRLQLHLTDGETHSRAVSVVLYNHLYKCLVTCGMDSFIIVWDLWTGKRLNLIKMSHSRVIHGEQLRVEITSACFDPKHQLLLTGARDGTLKVWNFKNAICIRNLSIESMCEVTMVFWVPNRMLAVGWNKHVTEFADLGETEYGDNKLWDVCHVEDVLAAAVRHGQSIATASYSGELIFWRLETGQPYRRYNVLNPSQRVLVSLTVKMFII